MGSSHNVEERLDLLKRRFDEIGQIISRFDPSDEAVVLSMDDERAYRESKAFHLALLSAREELVRREALSIFQQSNS
jgi:hypothetical protein